MTLKGKVYQVKNKPKRTEFNPAFCGKEGVVSCPSCGAIYYKKAWHHNLSKSLKNIKNSAPLKKGLCPACCMIKNRQFEGEIRLTNVPAKIKTELLNMAKAFGEREYQRDPMRRLIAVKNQNSETVLTTTENQLAVKLAKKIKEVFKKVDMKVSYSSAPSDVAYIKMSFKEQPVV